jgi:hypothetical protein
LVEQMQRRVLTLDQGRMVSKLMTEGAQI